MTDTPRTDEIDWLAIDDAYSEALEERCTCGDWRDDISCRHCSLWEKARSLMRQRIAELERLAHDLAGAAWRLDRLQCLRTEHLPDDEEAEADHIIDVLRIAVEAARKEQK